MCGRLALLAVEDQLRSRLCSGAVIVKEWKPVMDQAQSAIQEAA